MKDLTWSLERELFSHYLVEEEEEEDEGEDEKEGEDEDEEKGDGDEGEGHRYSDEAVGEVEGGGYRSFIITLIWMVSDIYPTMSLKVFNNLRNDY